MDAEERAALGERASLTDGRDPGDYRSRYARDAWFQIIAELTVVTTLLLLALVGLFSIARHAIHGQTSGFVADLLGPYPSSRRLLELAAMSLGGLCGGCSSSLKWLYHSVGKAIWNRDRIIWRLTVPVLSAVLGVFTGLMVGSGLVPFLSRTPFERLGSCAAFGFFIGIFSDNVLAALQNLANRTFGTVRDRAAGGRRGDDDSEQGE